MCFIYIVLPVLLFYLYYKKSITLLLQLIALKFILGMPKNERFLFNSVLKYI